MQHLKLIECSKNDEKEAKAYIDKHLPLHNCGYSHEYHNGERYPDDYLPIPVTPSPIEPIVKAALQIGAFGARNVRTGVVLYRGLSTDEVVGYDPANHTLTIDRITSFTPIRETAESHGSFILAVVLHDIRYVFTDDSGCARGCSYDAPCIYDRKKKYHLGDLGVETMLMPGTYKCINAYPSKA